MHGLGQRLSEKAAVHRPTHLPALDKTGPAEDLQMLHHGG
jgi:hypothetical protein